MYTKLLFKLFSPHSLDEDSQRKEFILNVLLLSSLLLFALAIVVSILVSFLRPEAYQHNSVPLLALLFTFLLFLALYIFSRRGHSSGGAHLLVFVFFLFAFLMGYRWGIDVNASLLIYALVIVMAGILVNTRFAFTMAGLITLSLFTVGHMQSAGVLSVDRYWRTQPWERSDTIMTIIIFVVIATVSWLSNREIESSLERAHRSEANLLKERDRLEITVEERTKELREAQLEKISQIYSLAEFGRLSSGLFHDLMNPLNAVSLNLEKAKLEPAGSISRAEQYLTQAFAAAQRMEKFIAAVRQQIGKRGNRKQFSPEKETELVAEILSYKALLENVEIVVEKNNTGEIIGDPIEWSQIMLNLIGNGIDAYDEIPKDRKGRIVTVAFIENSEEILCRVADTGIGIEPENIERIFEPFFTTKSGPSKGIGIGLSIVKRMIENNFGGSIRAESTRGVGTTFFITLPK